MQWAPQKIQKLRKTSSQLSSLTYSSGVEQGGESKKYVYNIVK